MSFILIFFMWFASLSSLSRLSLKNKIRTLEQTNTNCFKEITKLKDECTCT